jgi:hypothetical protein
VALAGCGGGGGSGGGGPESNGCPDDCLAGAWTITSQVLTSSGVTCGQTGLESIEIQLSLLQSDATWSLYDLTSSDIVMPSTGPTQSTLTFFVLQGPVRTPGFAGIFYVPSQNITVQLSTEAFPSFVTPSLSQNSFSTEVAYETYAGNAMVGTPQGGGVTSWEIDPNALELCSGALRIDGQRSVSALLAELPVNDGHMVLVGSWFVREGFGAPVVVRIRDERAEVQFEESSRALAPRAALLAFEGNDGVGLRFADPASGAALRLARGEAAPVWVGSLEFIDRELGVALRGTLVLADRAESPAPTAEGCVSGAAAEFR